MADDELMLTIARKTIRRVLEHPYGTVCKHWMVGCLIDEMESVGMEPTTEFVHSVCSADDEDALMRIDCELDFVAKPNKT